MKIKYLIATLSLAAVMSVGAVSIASAQNAKASEVSAATNGSLIVKLGNIGKWSESSAKLCAYMTDDSATYWTTLQTMSSGTNLYKFDYSINFTPTKLIWVRMNPAASSGNWSQKWNQTGDLGWNEATYLQDQWDPTTGQCSQWTLSAQVRSNLEPSFGTKTTLSTIGINGDGNPEVSGAVTLAVDEEFKMLAGDGTWSGYYGRPDALANCFDGGSRTSVSDQNPNIVCKVAGTYDFYFDTETKRVWISRQDIVDADGWADFFNKNVGCDSTGVSLPSGWSTVSSAYAGLSNDAKDYIYAGTAKADGDNLGRALATYDYAVSHHSTLDKFIKNRSGVIRNSQVITAPTVLENANTNSIAIVIIVAISSLTAIGGYFFLRKRREN